MSLADVKKSATERMGKSIETLKADLAKVRTGRAHTGILDHIQVDYYGAATALTQIANVTLIDARTIGVQPWEKKMITTVEKAIRDSDLGLNAAMPTSRSRKWSRTSWRRKTTSVVRPTRSRS
jgi:ribosome recycling factor